MKLIYYILFFSFIYVGAQAQTSIGIHAGYTNSWQEYGDVGLPDDAPIEVDGYHVALQLAYSFNPYFSIGIEPGLTRRGAACVPGWQPVFSGDTEFLLNYVEMPMMFAGHLPLFKERVILTGKVGYGGSFLATAKRKEKYPNNDTPAEMFDIELDENSILNRWDLGAYGDFEIAFRVGIMDIFADVSYYHGVINAEKWNQSLNRSIGYNLGSRVHF